MAAHQRSELQQHDSTRNYLLELEKLGRLHQVLELEGALWHVMRLAPLLDTSDVVLNLHRWKIRLVSTQR